MSCPLTWDMEQPGFVPPTLKLQVHPLYFMHHGRPNQDFLLDNGWGLCVCDNRNIIVCLRG